MHTASRPTAVFIGFWYRHRQLLRDGFSMLRNDVFIISLYFCLGCSATTYTLPKIHGYCELTAAASLMPFHTLLHFSLRHGSRSKIFAMLSCRLRYWCWLDDGLPGMFGRWLITTAISRQYRHFDAFTPIEFLCARTNSPAFATPGQMFPPMTVTSLRLWGSRFDVRDDFSRRYIVFDAIAADFASAILSICLRWHYFHLWYFWQLFFFFKMPFQ